MTAPDPEIKGVSPWLQSHWDVRAVGNFVGGGTGAGFLIALAAAVWSGDGNPVACLLGLALVAFGLTCVWLEIGRPWRFINVFFHPQTSWMTREGLVAMPLMAAGLAAAWLYSPPWMTIVAPLAAAYLYCQARLMQASKGIPAWRHPLVPPLIISSGLTEGAGLLLAIAPLVEGVPQWLPMALLAVLAARAESWRRYRARIRAGDGPVRAALALDEAAITMLWAGHAAPAALLVAGLADPVLAGITGMAAGLLALGAGWYMKFVIVTRAAFNQGFALTMAPRRGAGTAGPGTRPGWL